MRVWILLVFSLLLGGCGDGANYNRGYVISHSQVEASPDIEDPE